MDDTQENIIKDKTETNEICQNESLADSLLPREQSETEQHITNEQTGSLLPETDKEPEEDNKNVAQAVAEFDVDEDDMAEEDDPVNVIINPSSKGSIYKTGVTYQARSQAINSQLQKPTRQGINLNDPGNIQGVPTIDFNLTSLGDEEKPWKQPGSDITDYFNYGFTEDSWTQYCEKQKKLRQEYSNSSLKPVVVGHAAGLGLTGLSLTQRNRFIGMKNRQFENSNSAHNINVINLSANSRSHGARSSLTDDEETDEEDDELKQSERNSTAFNNSNSLAPGFSMPPPGYSSEQTAALAQLNNAAAAAAAANTFNLPPPGFANSSSVFPNIGVPPPVMNSNLYTQQQQGQQGQSGWTSSNSLISLLAGSAIRSAGHSGRISSDRRDKTPDDLFSDEERSGSRRHRHRGGDESDDRYDERYNRDQRRSSRRSRSRSRDRRYSSRNHRHYEDSSGDYSRHSERHRRRSPEHHSRSDRSSRHGGEYINDSGTSRSRDRERSGGGHRDSQRREQRRSGRDVRNTDRSSRHDSSSMSRSSRRYVTSGSRIDSKRTRSPQSRSRSPINNQSSLSPEGPKEPLNPMAAAAAAAAEIAARIKSDENDQMFV